uniref:Uncharacterized protein n=1 Tax=Triticum urartu TaxID=4572 RepID=A0A8R7PYP9_TRIUA
MGGPPQPEPGQVAAEEEPREEHQEAVDEAQRQEAEQEDGDGEGGDAEHLAREHVHAVAHHHGRPRAVVAQVQAHLHAGVAAADDQDPLPLVRLAGLVLGHVAHRALEGVGAVQVRDDALRVLARGHHQPTTDVLRDDLSVVGSVGGGDPPEAGGVVEACGDDGLAEAGADVEGGGVGLEVGDELVLGGVLGVVVGEGHARELAEVLGEVEAEAVVGAALPERGEAVVAVEDDGGDAARVQAGRRRDARRPRAHDDGAVHPHGARCHHAR